MGLPIHFSDKGIRAMEAEVVAMVVLGHLLQRPGRLRAHLVDDHVADRRGPQQGRTVRTLVCDDRDGVGVRKAEAQEYRGLVGHGTETSVLGSSQHGREKHLGHAGVVRLFIDGLRRSKGKWSRCGHGTGVVRVVLGLDGSVHDGPALWSEGDGDRGSLAADRL